MGTPLELLNKRCLQPLLSSSWLSPWDLLLLDILRLSFLQRRRVAQCTRIKVTVAVLRLMSRSAAPPTVNPAALSVNECSTEYTKDCSYGHCKQVPQEKCHQVPKESCRQVPQQSCKNVPKENCFNEVKKVPRTVCGSSGSS